MLKNFPWTLAMFKGVIHLKWKRSSFTQPHVVKKLWFNTKQDIQQNVHATLSHTPKHKAIVWLHSAIWKCTLPGKRINYIYKRATCAFFKSSPTGHTGRAMVNFSFKSIKGHKNPKCCQYSEQISWYETSGLVHTNLWPSHLTLERNRQPLSSKQSHTHYDTCNVACQVNQLCFEVYVSSKKLQ